MPSRHIVQHPARARNAAPVTLDAHETAHALASGETAVVEMCEIVDERRPGLHVLEFTVRVLDGGGVQVGEPIVHPHSVSNEALAADPDLLDTLADELRDTVVTKAANARAAAAQLSQHAIKRVDPKSRLARVP